MTNLAIKPLAPELAPDYLDFFENRAFTDDSPYRCYCQLYQMTAAQAQTACDGVDPADIGPASREIARQQILSGALQGYLAYADGVSIGWCNANDMVNYPAGPGPAERFQMTFEKRAPRRVKTVACFEIAPAYRLRGVATALLRQVISDARTQGYIAVEAFPVIRAQRYEWDCAGPLRLYQKAGFVKIKEHDKIALMRKVL